jgi:hypothetical protein
LIILCCPVTLWDTTRESLRKHAPATEIIPIPAADISYPWRILAERWAEDDLMYVEQDIIIHSEVVRQFEECPELYCLFPHPHYSHHDGELHDTGFGCNRLRKEFMKQVSVQDVEAVYGSCHRCGGGEDPRCWAHLDGRVREAGEAKGIRIHVHYPPVGHRGITGEEWLEQYG